MQQQRVNADLETAKITEPQRVENARLTAEAAEKAARDRRISEEIAATEAKRQRMENERLAEQERQRVEGTKQQVSEASCAQQASAWQNRFTLPALQPSGSAQYSFAASGMSAVGEAAELHNSFLAAQEQLSAIATISASGSVAAMIALGIYQTKVGESSERPPGWNVNPKFVGSISLSAMGLPATESLASQGEMALPVRMRIIDAKDWIGCTEIYAVKTGVAGVLPKVKVGAAQYDESTGVYTFTTDSTPPRTLIFTPAQPPGAETRPILAPPGSTPATLQHTGEMIIKPVITPTILPLPQLYARDFHDYIIWFPADSGLEPVYVYLNSPYGKTTAKGKYSGRDFNPDKAGGPIKNLDWKEIKIRGEGVDEVKLHTRRFGELEDNKLMIERLEKILTNKLTATATATATDIDKRFYTHEIRELERYRMLGIPDDVNDKSVWNDAHTATLEDFKINEKTQPLYTSEAEDAYIKAELKNSLGSK
ncbi:S-type pyocin domain-containing protein [Yersinia pseudotuberculosis]